MRSAALDNSVARTQLYFGGFQHQCHFTLKYQAEVQGPCLLHVEGTESGVADGMKVDSEGNVYCTGPGGVHIIDPSGKLLGRMRIAGHCTNMAWGDADWCSLYVTTFNKVCRTRVKVPGVAAW